MPGDAASANPRRDPGLRRDDGRGHRLRGWLRPIGIALASLLGLLLLSTTFAPELLAWPYKVQRGRTVVYAERPIPAEIERVLARADALLAQSPLDDRSMRRRIFLSEGGWRWRVAALTSAGAFGLRRPFRDAILFNRSDIAADRVTNGREVGGARTLSGTIAHELTHILVARRLGEIRARMLPTWKQEGYADHVARESSLSAADYRALKAEGADHPALPYYEGRLKVAEALRANGGDVDAMLAD
jgi:hypothetical protein